jgi:hypothetical protein
MFPAVRPALAWLLAFVMPFQALMVVYLDVRGPAHFHVTQDADHHVYRDVHDSAFVRGQGPTHEYSHVIQAMGLQAHGHVLGHSHTHGANGVGHHHHHPDDPSVVTIANQALPGDFGLREDTTSGWSGAMLVTLPGTGLSPHTAANRDVHTPRFEPLLKTRALGRLERPPRLIPS